MRSSFDTENIKSFVNNLLIGKEALKNLPPLPKLKTVNAWNEDAAAGRSEEL